MFKSQRGLKDIGGGGSPGTVTMTGRWSLPMYWPRDTSTSVKCPLPRQRSSVECLQVYGSVLVCSPGGVRRTNEGEVSSAWNRASPDEFCDERGRSGCQCVCLALKSAIIRLGVGSCVK